MKHQLKYVIGAHASAGNLMATIESFRRAHPGEAITVTVAPFESPKTKSQRDYFHGVVLATIARERGIEYWKVKEAIRQAFLTPVENPLRPGDYIMPSTESLTREDYTDLIEQTLAWAAEQGIYIPGPGEAM